MYNTIGKHKTKIFTNQDNQTCVKYHDTVIFKLDPINRHVILNSGGYHTTTTKRRINQALKQYNFNNITLFQKSFNWLLKIDNIINNIDFIDNIVIDF